MFLRFGKSCRALDPSNSELDCGFSDTVRVEAACGKFDLSKSVQGFCENKRRFSQNPRHLCLVGLRLLADVNADRHVAAAILTISDISIGADLQLAVHRRVLVDEESHALLTAVFLHQLLSLI